MGKFCIAGGCSNSSKDGVSLHGFPKREPVRKLWVNAVRNTRKDWLQPTAYSFLCSAHFDETCFKEFVGSRFAEFGLSPHKLGRLMDDAVPTLFGSKARPRHQEGSSPMDRPDVSSSGSRPSTTSRPSGSAMSTPGPVSFVAETVVKKRKIGGAFRKREHARTLEAAGGSSISEKPSSVRAQPLPTVSELIKRKKASHLESTPLMMDIASSEGESSIVVAPRDTVNVEVRDELAVETAFLSKDTQTDRSEYVEAYVQCAFVPLPPLEFRHTSEEFPKPATPKPSTPKPTTPLSVSPTKPPSELSEESSEPNQPSSPIYEPSSHSSDPSGDHGPGSSPVGTVEAVVWNIIGSMIRVRQRCKECANITFWDSQTLVGNIPHGNLMMSAGILFAGSNPSKTLRVFTNMYCPAITKRTFHRHQRNWLHPTISRVWRESQEEMIEGLKEIGMAVNLGGDGRSDSPGHSAKYGSYLSLTLTGTWFFTKN
ncbi:hypothetical protein BSL78_20880 [Apostichopus japonicus]|uniref:THAP-type domain-containing protein n=1 Tax=Stichopus japonicus TaxID=307972 RepID=A0A2G8K2P6_STIJA|nr:hypothetical protein BSL78_20880 [Apostichopus japonicus]